MATDAVKTEVGSYFISNYPPYSQWKKELLPEIESALASPPRPGRPLGLYLHIPFCRKRCKFCYFKVFTQVKSEEIEQYVSALSQEIELVSRQPIIGGRPFQFVYFGGGTPSFLSAKQLTSLVDRLRANISWDLAEEVTFECEPGTLSETKIHTLKDLGVTRLSLGVESFSDAILEENGRAHLSKEVYRAWEWITAAQFPNVNIDLISGMVGETWDNWKDNIKRVLELSPESITIYQMELPFNTVFSKDLLTGEQKESPVADWPMKRAWVKYAFEEFLSAGYSVNSAYTVVKDPKKINFSYRDNLFDGSDLLATGIASFGHASGVHYQNLPEWKDYIASLLEEHRLPLGRAYRPTSHQLLVREMILKLKKGVLEVKHFQSRYGVNIIDQWRSIWEEYRQEGWLTFDDANVHLTMEGLLRADGLLSAFFEDEFRGVRYT